MFTPQRIRAQKNADRVSVALWTILLGGGLGTLAYLVDIVY